MKLKNTLLAATLLCASVATAKNVVTTVEQVTSPTQLTDDVDYTITSTQPFGSMGSVDIQNTTHAVIILTQVKPSKCIADHLYKIYINGEQAQNGKNCQVKMHAGGCIILPYGDTFRPLTCYTEKNYQGESTDNYTTGSSGGYMKNLNKNTLNNQIRSFRLKRGYMVTFAIGTGGWGYSRCFIAAYEDLEVPELPAVLDAKISSYRLFKWLDASKKGLASDGNGNTNAILNTTWCYDWGQGNTSLLPDVEWVPNHIYEDWPSTATIGGRDGTCHTKANNEPANSADDHPQTVEEVLNNWQNMMRTGLRLCSPATHDGGWGWHNQFMDEIDKRGWRCDVVDFHGYWDGEWGSLDWRIDAYAHGRPVWFSEWVWGASWNRNGIFGQAPDGAGSFSERNQQKCYDGTKPILDRLNTNPRVERYAYWNSEADASKIYHYGNQKLSTLGQYYATMEVGLAFDPARQYIPKAVISPLGELTGTYNKNKKQMELTWTDPNGDMLDSVWVEVKKPGSAKWENARKAELQDQNSKNGATYNVAVPATEVGIHYFRVQGYSDGKKALNTNDVNCTVAAANAIGTLQYGQLKIANTDDTSTEIEQQPKAPYVVLGMVSNKNTANGIVPQLLSVSTKMFKARLYPWPLKTAAEIKTAETVDYIVLPPDTVMHLSDQMTLISQKAGNIKGEEVRVVFPEPFPQGVTPIVVAQASTSIKTYPPVIVKVYNITNEGFSAKLVRQEGQAGAFNQQTVTYYAATPGQLPIGAGKLLTVGRNDETPVGGTTRRTVAFTDAQGQQLHLQNPCIVACAQTHNYPACTLLRQHSISSDENGAYQGSYGRQIDPTSTANETDKAATNGDYIGWFIISDDPNGTGNEPPLIVPTSIQSIKPQGFAVSVQGSSLHCDQPAARAYNAAGRQVPFGQPLPAGIYVVTDGQKTTKVSIR